MDYRKRIEEVRQEHNRMSNLVREYSIRLCRAMQIDYRQMSIAAANQMTFAVNKFIIHATYRNLFSGEKVPILMVEPSSPYSQFHIVTRHDKWALECPFDDVLFSVPTEQLSNEIVADIISNRSET